jgi:AraC family transcriptional regulator
MFIPASLRRRTAETTKRSTSGQRLDRAAAELVTGSRPIAEIAVECCASPELFTRTFLQRFGMSPRAYRNRGLSGAGARANAREHASIVRS